VTERAGIAGQAPGSAAWRLAVVGLPLLVVLHFGLLIAVMAAPQAIPLVARPAVEAYLVPVFAQDWRLFAPRPDLHDYAVFARAATRSQDRLSWTPWQNIVDPLVAEVRANRLAPEALTLNLAYKSAARTFDRAGPLSQLPMGRDAVADRWERVEGQPASLIVLERLACAALAEANPDQTLEAVQVMLTSNLVGLTETPATGSQVLLLHPISFLDVSTR
jgi:Family of unknown function (DUF5819)